jgi:cystathionine gamma-lyase
VGPGHIQERSSASIDARDNIQRAVATLEHSRFAVAFSSGSAAVASLTLTLEQGAHMVSVADLYGGTREYFSKLAGTHGVHVTFTNNIEDELPHLIRPNQTKMIWIETPSNPTMKVVDIARIADFAHNYDIKVVVDNTFLSPYIQTPLDHGADVVVHSVTKYLNGHSVSLNHVPRSPALSSPQSLTRNQGCDYGHSGPE